MGNGACQAPNVYAVSRTNGLGEGRSVGNSVGGKGISLFTVWE